MNSKIYLIIGIILVLYAILMIIFKNGVLTLRIIEGIIGIILITTASYKLLK
jgi:hypothetical protein